MADLGAGYYLVQLFDWFVGDASTQHVMPISEFASKTPEGKPRFRFFDSLKDANDYMDTWGRTRDKRIDEGKDEPEK